MRPQAPFVVPEQTVRMVLLTRCENTRKVGSTGSLGTDLLSETKLRLCATDNSAMIGYVCRDRRPLQVHPRWYMHQQGSHGMQAQKQGKTRPAAAFKLHESEGMQDLLSLMQNMSVGGKDTLEQPQANGDLSSHTHHATEGTSKETDLFVSCPHAI